MTTTALVTREHLCEQISYKANYAVTGHIIIHNTHVFYSISDLSAYYLLYNHIHKSLVLHCCVNDDDDHEPATKISKPA